MAKSQATKQIKAERIDRIITMLQSGMYSWEIIGILSTEWNCSERNVYKYMTACYKLLSVHYSKEVVDNILAKYDFLYRRSIANKDDKLAVKILDSISIVKGLRVNKTDITSGGEKMTTIINIIKPE